MSAALGALSIHEPAIHELAARHWDRELDGLLATLNNAAAGARHDTNAALAARLDPLRAAGSPALHPLTLRPDDLVSVAAALLPPVRLDPVGMDPAVAFDPKLGRVLLTLLLVCAEILSAGGTVRLAGSAREVFLQLSGPTSGWPDGAALCFVNPDAAAKALQESRLPRVALAAVLAHQGGIVLSTLLSPHHSAPPILRISAT
jgi:hypothetical protein